MATSKNTLMPSQSSFPSKFIKLDILTITAHHYLDKDDLCVYFGEYAPHKGFAHSPTNKLIINLKKPMDRKGTFEWKYKGKSIISAAQALCEAFDSYNLSDYTFVPVPPSKAKNNPKYDDRMLQILDHFATCHQKKSSKPPPPHILEIVTQNNNRPAAHEGNNPRPSISDLVDMYYIDSTKISQVKGNIIIFDDVLTKGTSYKAMKALLSKELPDAQFYGVFLARSVLSNQDDFADVDI